MSWIWLSKSTVLAFHAMQIAEHGGGDGLRDEGLLESALSRPENMVAYGTPTVFDLGAAYAFGIAKSHPFVDGNKRTAFVAAVVFLEMNDYVFQASEVDVILKVLALAAGEMDENSFSSWLQQNTKKA